MKIKIIFILLLLLVLINSAVKDNNVLFVIFNTLQVVTAIVYGIKKKKL